LNEHLEDCRNLNVKQKVKLPEQDVNDKLKFTGFQKQNKKPIVLYADFESINSKNPKTNSNTSKDTKHLPTSYMIFIKSDIDLNIPLTYKYKGLDANEHFVKTIMKIESHLKFKIKEAKGIWGDTMKPLSPTQQDHHNTCNTCRFCNQQIKTNKVRDHCHYTGNYRGPAHEECNLKASCPKRETIPIMFHNLNYDLRMIIQAFDILGGDKNRVEVIAQNSENYKTLKLNSYQFMDTMAFQMASLETLISALPEEKKINMKRITSDPEKFKLICQKGEFPYE